MASWCEFLQRTNDFTVTLPQKFCNLVLVAGNTRVTPIDRLLLLLYNGTLTLEHNLSFPTNGITELGRFDESFVPYEGTDEDIFYVNGRARGRCMLSVWIYHGIILEEGVT